MTFTWDPFLYGAQQKRNWSVQSSFPICSLVPMITYTYRAVFRRPFSFLEAYAKKLDSDTNPKRKPTRDDRFTKVCQNQTMRPIPLSPPSTSLLCPELHSETHIIMALNRRSARGDSMVLRTPPALAPKRHRKRHRRPSSSRPLVI